MEAIEFIGRVEVELAAVEQVVEQLAARPEQQEADEVEGPSIWPKGQEPKHEQAPRSKSRRWRLFRRLFGKSS